METISWTAFRLGTVIALMASSLVAMAELKGVSLSVNDASGREIVRYEGSYALLVGVSDYTNGWPDLPNIDAELDEVQSVLEGQGFQVRRVDDPNSEELKAAFDSFIGDFGYRRDNRLLFFFSGHGHTWAEEGHGYLVPADAPRPNGRSGPGQAFLRKALHMSEINAWARKMTVRHALFAFDSCFSGMIFQTKGLADEPRHITKAMSEKVRLFITAGDAGDEVPAQSAFTPAFVDALSYGKGDLNSDGYVTGMELGLHLQQAVSRFELQTPQFGKIKDPQLSRGDFVFKLATSVSPLVPEPPGNPEEHEAADPPTPTRELDDDPPGRSFSSWVGVAVAITAIAAFFWWLVRRNDGWSEGDRQKIRRDIALVTQRIAELMQESSQNEGLASAAMLPSCLDKADFIRTRIESQRFGHRIKSKASVGRESKRAIERTLDLLDRLRRQPTAEMPEEEIKALKLALLELEGIVST